MPNDLRFFRFAFWLSPILLSTLLTGCQPGASNVKIAPDEAMLYYEEDGMFDAFATILGSESSAYSAANQMIDNLSRSKRAAAQGDAEEAGKYLGKYQTYEIVFRDATKHHTTRLQRLIPPRTQTQLHQAMLQLVGTLAPGTSREKTIEICSQFVKERDASFAAIQDRRRRLGQLEVKSNNTEIAVRLNERTKLRLDTRRGELQLAIKIPYLASGKPEKEEDPYSSRRILRIGDTDRYFAYRPLLEWNCPPDFKIARVPDEDVPSIQGQRRWTVMELVPQNQKPDEIEYIEILKAVTDSDPIKRLAAIPRLEGFRNRFPNSPRLREMDGYLEELTKEKRIKEIGKDQAYREAEERKKKEDEKQQLASTQLQMNATKTWEAIQIACTVAKPATCAEILMRIDAFLANYPNAIEVALAKDWRRQISEMQDKDKAYQKKLAAKEEEGKKLLSLAEAFKDGGKNAKAREYLDKIINDRDFEGTESLNRAKKMKAELPK